MKAFITRPEEDAAPLARELAIAGVEPVMAPLMRIVPEPGGALDLEGVGGLAFTSANGVRAYLARAGRMDVPAFAVGAATAALLREAGFARVFEAGGDVASLSALIIEKADPDAGVIYHGAGAALAGDLAGTLKGAGFTVRREVLYRAEPAADLPVILTEALQSGAPGLLLLYSPRTAKIAIDLIKKAGLRDRTGAFRVLCLSAAVAAVIKGESEAVWDGVFVASQPHSGAMIELVHTLVPGRFNA